MLADRLARGGGLATWPDWARRRPWGLLLGAIATVNGLFFLVGPDDVRTWPKIREFDREFGERIAAVREQFPPQTTAVLAHKRYGRLVDVHLQGYREPQLSGRLGEIPIAIAPEVRTLVLLDDRVFRRPEQDIGFRAIALPSGETLPYLVWPETQQLVATEAALQLQPLPPRSAP